MSYQYYTLVRGNKNYEMSNHLGNVLAVLSDKRLMTCSNDTVNYYTADLLQATDYSAFGVSLKGRTWQAHPADTIEVLKNDFNGGTTQSWASTNTATVVNSSNKLSVTTNANADGAYRTLTVEKGKTYRYKIHIDPNGATCGFYTLVKYGGSTYAIQYISSTSPADYSITFNVPGTSVDLYVIPASAPGGSITYYVDDVLVEEAEEYKKRYRFGFNGKEQDNETYGDGNEYDFGARIYSPRLGRWLSVDPLAKKYAPLSPYGYVAGNPIAFIDADGREIEIPKSNQSIFITDMKKIFGESADKMFSFDSKSNLLKVNAAEGLSKDQQKVYNAILTVSKQTDITKIV